jgi:glutamyl-tRNA reductase
VANENVQGREKEAQNAEAIVQEEVAKFVHWYRSLDITPTIVALRKKFDEIRKRELQKTLSLHPNLSEKEKKSLEALTSAIINKILHEPLTLLKRNPENGASELYLDTLQTLFGLSEKLPENLDEENLKENPNPDVK